jgi:putative oxidoreductase
VDYLKAAQAYVIALFRIVLGFLFACHGVATLFGVFGGAFGTKGGSVPVGAWPDGYAAVIQIATGTAVALGLATRYAAIVAAGTMAFAYFSVHQGLAALPIENGGEPAVLFSWSFLLLAATGAGAFSLERLVARARSANR